MPNELNLPLGQTGLTVTAQLAVGTAYVGSAIACPELPAGSGRYSGDVPGGTAAGTYDVLFKSGGSNIGGGVLHWDGTAEINIRTVNTRIGNIPTNPLLTNDGRITTIVNDLDSLESQTVAILQDTSIDIPASINAIPAAPASSDIYAYFTAGIRANAFKADLTATNTAIDNLAAAIGSIPAAPTPPAPSDIYGYFIGENREDAFKNDLTNLQNGVGAIALTLSVIQGAGFTSDTDSLAAIRNRGDVAWLTPDLTAMTQAIVTNNQAIAALGLSVTAVGENVTAVLEDTNTTIPEQISTLIPAGAIARIDTYAGRRSRLEGFVTGVTADFAAPTELMPGYMRSSDGQVDVIITPQPNGVRRVAPGV